jgi:hypothetical protein
LQNLGLAGGLSEIGQEDHVPHLRASAAEGRLNVVYLCSSQSELYSTLRRTRRFVKPPQRASGYGTAMRQHAVFHPTELPAC